MKKIGLFIVASFFSFAIYSQQETPDLEVQVGERTINFGIDAGLNYSWLGVNRGSFPNLAVAPHSEIKPSFYAGAFALIPIGERNLYLKPHVMYSRQGGEVEQPILINGVATVEYTERLDYVYIAPSLLHVELNGWFIETGPALGILTFAEQDGPAPFNGDVMDSRSAMDFMWNAGIGYISPMGLGAHIRYNHGFMNVLDIPQDGTIMNRNFQLGLTYRLGM